MHSVYPGCPADRAGLSAADDTAADRQAQLRGVVQRGRAWLDGIPPSDPQREHLIRMGILAEDLLSADDPSRAAMTTINALLCANCRQLGAAAGQCSGQALDRCPLLPLLNGPDQ